MALYQIIRTSHSQKLRGFINFSFNTFKHILRVFMLLLSLNITYDFCLIKFETIKLISLNERL